MKITEHFLTLPIKIIQLTQQRNERKFIARKMHAKNIIISLLFLSALFRRPRKSKEEIHIEFYFFLLLDIFP